MDDIAISKFKATCLAVLEQVRKSGKPIQVTRFGQPVAEIFPPAAMRTPRRLGARVGSGVILGDIVAPISTNPNGIPAREVESSPSPPKSDGASFLCLKALARQ
jgi:antitoxin (DNA-binding transcriptional repressor) of toxin-antitoxin stability system